MIKKHKKVEREKNRSEGLTFCRSNSGKFCDGATRKQVSGSSVVAQCNRFHSNNMTVTMVRVEIPLLEK